MLAIAVLGLACIGLTGCADDGATGPQGLAGQDGLDGQDGAQGDPGPQGPPGPTAFNLLAMSDEELANLEVVSEVTDVTISSPPVVTFTLRNPMGIPIVGLVHYWEDSNRFVRFTLAKLVPGGGDNLPDSWVNYVRDAESGEPDYDSGSSLVDNGDGSYTFTFNTDVTAVPGIAWDPLATHRLAGQLGDRDVALEPQNFVYDFVPAGGPLPLRRAITTMETCNECHDNLVFHGRRFKIEYCTNCHNPDLVGGEGDMAYMIHRIHNGGTFATLDGGADFSELTYPQDTENCRKCHEGTAEPTPQGDNWQTKVYREACAGCHPSLETNSHPVVPSPTNVVCLQCHGPGSGRTPAEAHATTNSTPHNPELLPGENGGVDQRSIAYELIDAAVNPVNGDITVNFRILSDGTPLDLTNLPADLLAGGRWPGFLLAWALPQDGLTTPMDYNNLGRERGQPLSVALDTLVSGENGSLSFAGGINTAVITEPTLLFPVGATLRAIGLQGYFRQDITNDGAYDVSLHTPSAVVAVTGDAARREVVDSAKCGSCHEWFEGHGGNRTYEIAICTLCHVPNLSSSGRTIAAPGGVGADIDDAVTAGTLDASADGDDALTWPEDAQNLKDLVHGIHSSGFRTRDFQHVRGGGHSGYYDWAEVTFPRGASTSNCLLCHKDGSFELPLPGGLLPTTVRTTGVSNGLDATIEDVAIAGEDLPNSTDWINTPTASACFYCHTTTDAQAHMTLNGGLLSDPSLPLGILFRNRGEIGLAFESCAVCHGPDKPWALRTVHGLDD
jgi:OmcA/MtrC family decaheme c-type cytochrome